MGQAVLAFGVALIGFLGVALGAVVTGYVTLRQAQLATQREREAEQMLRWQARKDAHDAFQRDTILALQDALGDLIRAVVQEQQRMLAERAESGRWTAKRRGDPLGEIDEARWVIGKLRARIFDPELRDLANTLLGEVLSMPRAEDLQAMRKCVERLNDLHYRIDNRVTVLLPHLF